MRKVKLDKLVEDSSKSLKEKKGKGRPTPKWKLVDSIKYIKMRDEYLRRKGILVKKGKRKFQLNL